MDEGTEIDWRDWITSDPDVMVGKPVVKGTRLTVEFLLGLMAAGWTTEMIFENYPHLPREGLRAVLGYGPRQHGRHAPLQGSTARAHVPLGV